MMWWALILMLSSPGFCDAVMLYETHFEDDSKTRLETFVTPNGTVGEAGWPLIVLFETAQEGQGSNALQFKVGQIRYDQKKALQQGGGLVFQVSTDAGNLELSAHIAVTYHSPKDRRNLAGGLFEWIVDDHVIVHHDIGPIDNGGVIRHHLHAQYSVKSGIHTVRLRITRPFTSQPGQHAPFQYVDDVLVQLSPNP